MMKPLLVVIAVGVGVGLMLPGSPPEAAPASARAAAAGGSGTVSPTEPLRELSLERRPDGHFYVEGLVNGHETRFLIDTGATHIALTLDDAKRAGIAVSPEDFQYVGEGAGGALRGQPVMLDRVAIGGRVVTNARAAVIDGLSVSLLGQSVLTQLGTLEMNDRRLTIR